MRFDALRNCLVTTVSRLLAYEARAVAMSAELVRNIFTTGTSSNDVSAKRPTSANELTVTIQPSHGADRSAN